MAELGQSTPNRFGKRVLGEEAWNRQIQEQKSETAGGATKFGRRVMGSSEPPAQPAAPKPASDPGTKVPSVPTTEPTTEPKPESSPEAFVGMTLEELEEILGLEPELLDDAIAAEMVPGPARKGALQLFERIERGKAEPREKVLSLLESAG